MQPSHMRSETATDLLCKVTAYHCVFHKYSTCTVKEGYVLSCIIYVNFSNAQALRCSKNSKLSSEGQWKRFPPTPSFFGYMPKANMKISVPAAQCHEDSDNETQINSPSFDLWRA